jgi:putative membrane protein
MEEFAMKSCRWIEVLAAAAVLLPSALVAQVDPSQVQTSAPQGTMSGSQPATTMRDTLGAPGLRGQELADRTFVRAAVEGGIVEVSLGQLAVQKGGADVKIVAQKLVDDHAAINKDMGTVADSLGVLLPKKMSKDGQAEFDKLNGLAGKDFDVEYVNFVFKAHMKDMHDFYMEASTAADPGLATATANAMKTMHEHVGMLAKVAATDGITLPPRPPRPPRPDAGHPDAGPPPPGPPPMPPEK